MTATASGNGRRILLRLPNWVGDIMMALPAIESLRQALPAARLVGMVRPGHVELAQRITALDDVVAAPPQSGLDRYRAVWKSARELRDGNFDMAVLLAPSFEAALTVWLAGIPVRLGHDTDHRTALLNRVVETREGHRGDSFEDLVSELGAKPRSGGDVFRCVSSDRDYAEQFLHDSGVDPATKPVFVNPASAKKPRAWSSDRFRTLVEGIATRHPGVAVVVHDHHPFEAPAAWRSGSIHTLRDATLVELAGVIKRCSLYVGNDSGPMHIAAALGVPTIGIYGPSSPSRTSPNGAHGAAHIPISASFECSPCRERFFDECPSPPSSDERPPCLNEISVERVADQVDQLLGSFRQDVE